MERPDPSPMYIGSFGHTFLVECRACDGCAVVRMTADWPLQGRATCSACGYVLEQASRKEGWSSQARTQGPHDPASVVWGAPVDPCLHLSLWLRTPCCGQELWAYNGRHLDWLRGFVSAGLRPNTLVEGGYRNQQLASRLPKWMLSAKNRGGVLDAITRLEERLAAR